MRDVQRNYLLVEKLPNGNSAFLFAVVETYSGTRSPELLTATTSESVSIRCRARRTAELGPIQGRAGAVDEFLFAVVRDVQRNTSCTRVRQTGGPSFYSLSCETYSGTDRVDVPITLGTVSFLFAVVRDVQRNWSGSPQGAQAKVSIRCRARRTAERPLVVGLIALGWTFLFAVVRDVQRNTSPTTSPKATVAKVSIRCRARRTAERSGLTEKDGAIAFLFAVVRDVQRNATPRQRR